MTRRIRTYAAWLPLALAPFAVAFIVASRTAGR